MNRSDLSNHVVQGSGHGENPKEEKKTCWYIEYENVNYILNFFACL